MDFFLCLYWSLSFLKVLLYPSTVTKLAVFQDKMFAIDQLLQLQAITEFL